MAGFHHGHLPMRRGDFPRDLRHTHKNISMPYRIEAINEALDAPAGRFEKCLCAQGSAGAYAGLTFGWHDLPLKMLERHCPVEELGRHAPVASPGLTGGVLKMELASWD